MNLLGYFIQWHQSGSCKCTVNLTNKIPVQLNHCLHFCHCFLQFLNMVCYFSCADACWTISQWGAAGRSHPQYWVHFNSLCIVWWYDQWPAHHPGSDMYGHLDFCFVSASATFTFDLISYNRFYYILFCLEDHLFHVSCIFLVLIHFQKILMSISMKKRPTIKRGTKEFSPWILKEFGFQILRL